MEKTHTSVNTAIKCSLSQAITLYIEKVVNQEEVLPMSILSEDACSWQCLLAYK